jgi:hypothetical protein
MRIPPRASDQALCGTAVTAARVRPPGGRPLAFWLAAGLAVLLAAGGGHAAGQEVTVIVDESDCRWLVAHRPDAGVAYRPGVDAEGRPVAPADLPGSPGATLPREVRIALSLRLGDLLGARIPPLLGKSEAYVGTVTVDTASGQAYLDGQELPDPAANAIARVCAERLRGSRRQ